MRGSRRACGFARSTCSQVMSVAAQSGRSPGAGQGNRAREAHEVDAGNRRHFDLRLEWAGRATEVCVRIAGPVERDDQVSRGIGARPEGDAIASTARER